MLRLSGMDASFLYMETPTHHMHVCGTLVLDPSSRATPLALEDLRNLIRARIHLMPMLRRRVLPVPLGLDHPVWLEDPDFDVEHHVRRITVHAPGTMRELAEIVGDIASTPLNRSRPLWEMALVEGLADGNLALVSKMHHACIDGVTGADLMAHLLDLEPDAGDPEPPATPWEPDEVPSELHLATDAVASRLADPFRTVRAIGRTTASLATMARSILPVGDDGLRPALPFTGPRTILNAPITAKRVVAFGQASLDDIKVAKNTFGTTVNDVVLAASALSLRRYLLAHDDLPERPLIAAVPVSVHATDGVGTNQVSNMFVRLPLDGGVPDGTTRCRFRGELARRRLTDRLLAAVDAPLVACGLVPRRGMLIDASLVEADADLRKGPDGRPVTAEREAGFATRRGKAFFGFKAHLAVDGAPGCEPACKKDPVLG